MVDKGYFIVWDIVEFKSFRASFCWTPPDLIEVSHVVAFLGVYLTWSLLLSYGARYIPNIKLLHLPKYIRVGVFLLFYW